MKNGLLLSLLIMAATALSAQTLPLTFETGTFTFTDFAGGVMTVIDNPNSGGINTSSKVAQMVKGPGEVYGGSFIQLAGPVDLSASQNFKVKVFANRVGVKLLFKLENAANGALNFEQERATTVANAWEELSYDFSAINTANTYEKVVFIMELGTVGNSSADFTMLIDDVRLPGATGPVLSQISLPVTFDDTTVNYTMTDFGGNASEVVVDPTNAANKVAKTTKGANAELWAGTTAGTGAGFPSNVPFAAGSTKMRVRVWSPDAGIPVRLKVEDRTNPAVSVETEATTTVASQWQTLVFDFANQATGTAAINFASSYNKASIFFNFGTTGATAGVKTYYWDDMAFGDATGIENLISQGFRYFPNPAENQLFLSADLPLQDVKVFSITGQQMLSVSPEQMSHTLDLSTLSAGMYLVRVSLGNENGTFRIIKQ
ncbi:MAG: T9SS C-terminal target domain-containing protein [Bacteroidetes bacterium]|nr:MAG: T9SS C-terminal target domain-containing protein [Bacteroidota bacterium]